MTGSPGGIPEIPNRAWGFWAQGESELDAVVAVCLDSWRTNGKFDQITILDGESVFDFLPRATLPRHFPALPVQIQSDLVRLALLNQYGGVWMDASTIVSFPVKPWLETVASGSGLFVFQNGGRGKGGRRFETGFIAAAPGNPFIQRWLAEMVSFFNRKRIHRVHSAFSDAPVISKKIFGVLNAVLRKNHWRSALWARAPLRWLPFYPFFIVHYLGNWVLQQREHASVLDSFTTVDASRYLGLRGISNARGWVKALSEADLTRVPVHDVEFRKHLGDGEFEALQTLANRLAR